MRFGPTIESSRQQKARRRQKLAHAAGRIVPGGLNAVTLTPSLPNLNIKESKPPPMAKIPSLKYLTMDSVTDSGTTSSQEDGQASDKYFVPKHKILRKPRHL